MGYKILNLSTGHYYNGAVGSEYYDLPDSSYYTRENAEKQIGLILLSAQIVKGCKLIKEHLEIVKLD